MKNYLFDFDGTLIDSMPTFVSVMLGVLDKHGIKYDSDIVKTLTPLGLLGSARYFRDLGIDKSEEEICEIIMAGMREEYALRIPAKDKVTETLRSLYESGARLHILTASPHENLDPCLMRLGLSELFDNVWSCDDFGTTKADPEIYKRVAELIGAAPSDIIFVDDNYNADMTARSAGMRVYGIYDPSSAEYESDMRRDCDAYLENISDILDLK